MGLNYILIEDFRYVEKFNSFLLVNNNLNQLNNNQVVNTFILYMVGLLKQNLRDLFFACSSFICLVRFQCLLVSKVQI